MLFPAKRSTTQSLGGVVGDDLGHVLDRHRAIRRRLRLGQGSGLGLGRQSEHESGYDPQETDVFPWIFSPKEVQVLSEGIWNWNLAPSPVPFLSLVLTLVGISIRIAVSNVPNKGNTTNVSS